jgi:hypothetical protein
MWGIAKFTLVFSIFLFLFCVAFAASFLFAATGVFVLSGFGNDHFFQMIIGLDANTVSKLVFGVSAPALIGALGYYFR